MFNYITMKPSQLITFIYTVMFFLYPCILTLYVYICK